MRFFLTVLLIYALNTVVVYAKSFSNMTYGDVTVSEVVSVYDGDTFKVHIACWPGIVGYRISVRIVGIDTFEIRGKCQAEKDQAKLAKQFVTNHLQSAQIVELRNIKRGKYFRILADVFVDEINLAEAIIEAGLAVVYDGGTKTKNWCEVPPKEEITPKEPTEIILKEEAIPKEITPKEVIPQEIAPEEVTPTEIIPKETTPKEITKN